MPTAFFDSGAITTSGDTVPRQLIPGIEPGGSRVGAPTKPALQLRDVWLEQIVDIVDAGVTADFTRAMVFLKLSQESDLSPGLLLPIANIVLKKTTTAQLWNDIEIIHQGDKLAGQIFTPAYVGLRTELSFTGTVRFIVGLRYERVDIDWMSWFLHWDFLDNITDNSTEY